VLPDKPVTVIDWEVTAERGAGSPVTCVAEAQVRAVIVEVEYLISYVVAVPVLLSSPGAVQERFMVVAVGLEVARLETAAGAVVSGVAVVVPVATFERFEVFGTSSKVFIAK
jgi:hypothetical protein